MTIRARVIWQFFAYLTLVFMAACSPLIQGTPLFESNTAAPTAPATLPEVIDALSGYSAEARITAAQALPNFGKEAIAAVPALTQNLRYETTGDVRRAAAIALGQFGPDARSAVPELIDVLQTDDAIRVRVSAAEALGRIGDLSSVPALVDNLYGVDIEFTTSTKFTADMELTIVSAISLSLITGESLPDADSQHGYRLNEEGIPLVVIAAREWWESEGKHREWPTVSPEQG